MDKVDTRLPAETVAEIKRIAKEETRSYCEMLRLLILRGLREFKADKKLKKI